jgi:hypothetical protein
MGARAVKKLRLAWLAVLVAPLLWVLAPTESVPRDTQACCPALAKATASAEAAGVSESSAGRGMTVLLALLVLEQPPLPQHLPFFYALSSQDGTTEVDGTVLHCASVRPPPLV